MDSIVNQSLQGIMTEDMRDHAVMISSGPKKFRLRPSDWGKA